MTPCYRALTLQWPQPERHKVMVIQVGEELRCPTSCSKQGQRWIQTSCSTGLCPAGQGWKPRLKNQSNRAVEDRKPLVLVIGDKNILHFSDLACLSLAQSHSFISWCCAKIILAKQVAKKGVSKEAAAVSSFNLRSAFHFFIKGACRAVILCWKDSPLVCWGHSLPLELELNPPPPQHPHAPAFPFLWHSVSCIAPLKHFPLLGSSHSSLIMSSRVAFKDRLFSFFVEDVE